MTGKQRVAEFDVVLECGVKVRVYVMQGDIGYKELGSPDEEYIRGLMKLETASGESVHAMADCAEDNPLRYLIYGESGTAMAIREQ